MLRSYSLVFAALLFCAGCDGLFPSGKEDPPATNILGLRVEPDPVPVGATATLTVVHSDSTASGLSYYWELPGSNNNVRTNAPQVQWSTPAEPGQYRLAVDIDREGNYDNVSRAFNIPVVAE